MPESAWLDDEETLTYLHSTVSTKRQRVRVPEIPMYLDALLADQPLTGGLEPMLGQSASAGADDRRLSRPPPRPGFWTSSNQLAFAYRWSTRAIMLDKTDATQAADQNPTAMVCQAQIDCRDPEGGDDQRGLDAARYRRPQQGDGCRRGVAGTRIRRDRAGLCHRDGHGLGRRPAAPPTKSSAWSRRSFRAATSPAWWRASTRSKPGWARCRATPMPMSASRRSRR